MKTLILLLALTLTALSADKPVPPARPTPLGPPPVRRVPAPKRTVVSLKYGTNGTIAVVVKLESKNFGTNVFRETYKLVEVEKLKYTPAQPEKIE